MPFQIHSEKPSAGIHRCVVCGKIAVKPIFYKTCCMNKPVVFCSRVCARRWISEWMRNQEQLMKSRSRLSGHRRVLRRDL